MPRSIRPLIALGLALATACTGRAQGAAPSEPPGAGPEPAEEGDDRASTRPAPAPERSADEAVPPSHAPHPDAAFAPVDEAAARGILGIPDDVDLVHTAFRGPFGPDDAGVVGLGTTTGRDLVCHLAAPGRATVSAGVSQPWMLQGVPAVMFEDVDGDGHRDLIALARWMTGMGPTGAQSFPSNAVFRWTGTTLQALDKLPEGLAEAPDAAAVRAALARAGSGAR